MGEGKVINPDDVVAVRTAALTAAAGFLGAGWTVTAAAGYTLDFRGEDNSYAGHTVRALAGEEWALELTTALEQRGRTVAARARALCEDCLAGQFVTVTAVFAAVLAPAQATLAEVYGEDGDGAHGLTPPADYATGGTFTVAGVSGPGGSFVVDGTGAGVAAGFIGHAKRGSACCFGGNDSSGLSGELDAGSDGEHLRGRFRAMLPGWFRRGGQR